MILFHWNCLQIKGTWLGAFFYTSAVLLWPGLVEELAFFVSLPGQYRRMPGEQGEGLSSLLSM